MNRQNQYLTKDELLVQIKRFLDDEERGISKELFAELCGISKSQLVRVFDQRSYPLTEHVQIRVNKGYWEWKQGNVRVMKRPDNTRYVEYRRASKPAFMPSMGLKVTNQGIKLRIGLKNRHDYSEDPLDDQLRG